MKHAVILLLLSMICVFDVTMVFSRRCAREIKTCNVTEAGVSTLQDYNTCTKFCCGGKLEDRDVDNTCCGTEQVGAAYNKTNQICCLWKSPAGTEYAVQDNTEPRSFCCGTELFTPDMFQNQSCCNSYFNRPALFNHRTEMCCGGNVQFSGETGYTSCCGDISYDRRVASCPCHDGVVTPGIPDPLAGCCYGQGTNVRKSYNKKTQDCCNGEPYDKQGQFCCGNAVGDATTEICCSGTVVARELDQIGATVACCLLLSGSSAPYNVNTQVCCGGSVQNMVGNTTDQNCCGGVVYNSIISGALCCNGVPYDSDTGGLPFDSPTAVCCDGNIVGGDACCNDAGITTGAQVCCDGVVGFGDACCSGEGYVIGSLVCCGDEVKAGNFCCNGSGYFEGDQICCAGVLSAGNSCCKDQGFFAGDQVCCADVISDVIDVHYASCCVNTTFDTREQTCCGVTLFNNPLVPRGENGSSVVSSTTRCCGDFSDDRALLPYDYLSAACCNGVIVDLDGISIESAECCVDALIDTNTNLCCDGVAVDRLYGLEAVCCGGVSINITSTICCGGVPSPRNANSVCCGGTAIDTDLSICCNNVPLDLNGVLPENAICCGGTAIDTGVSICCNNVPLDLNGVLAEDAVCCGDTVIDDTVSVCCNNIPQDLNFILPDDAVCCGDAVMDPNLSKCCNNVPRSLNGVAPDKAICCGEGCIDGTQFFCCEGKQYSKGAREGIDVTGLTCDELFPGAG